jgi:hypothetical protein
MEIERKWLLSSKPESIEAAARYVVDTTYLSHGDVELRIRQALHDDSVGDKTTWGIIMPEHTMTIKGPGDLSREEVEFILDFDQYNILRTLSRAEPIHSDIHLYDLHGHRIDVCEVDREFLYAEVEFESEWEAKDYRLPLELEQVLIKEVTYDPSYKMKNYWARSRG